MSLSDPLADMFTRLRNAQKVGHEKVSMPHSNLKVEIAGVLKSNGFIKDYVVEGGTKKTLTIYIKFVQGMEPAIREIRRESRPGLRKFFGAADIPRILDGLGVGILSTSHGIMTDKEARSRNVGGELLCSVW